MLLNSSHMKKAIFLTTLAATLGFAACALAAPTPVTITPIKTTPQVTITADPIVTSTTQTSTLPKFVVDPILLPTLTTSSASGSTTIDPDLLKNLQPLPLQPIVIPPDLIKGPRILDTQFSTDGNLLRITWTTDKDATSKVEYGTTDAYGKTLKDTTLTTDHQMIIPATPGTMHLRLSSSNALKQTTESEDIALSIPEAVPPTVNENTAATPTEEAVTEPEPTDLPAATAPTIVTEAAPVETGVSITNAVLGGAVILLVGLIIGFAIRGKKKQHHEDTVV